ncbi:peptide chain release factor N(5)-glutamine methyltransferase [Cohnella sp. GbtcB17]|uniref:peptide chain release factor N(5)-glutamine methyltransferase n=1 Tax=Cohnella sp. GbtcB17 TaxID=2824762 RepID=UPI001C2FD94F|nr:peptide chain release factor N(5)-glutamine methyltransferase [Cohnella sp. GbtcB17]
MERGQTYGEVWKAGVRRLAEAGIEEAEAESGAELLILHLLGIGKAELLRDLREPFPEAKRDEWEAMLARRAAGEPAQYVTGEQYFYGRKFAVTPAVLIPRPETELLAEAVLEGADKIVATRKARGDEGQLRVLDVGTGSGALAVTLKLERPDWQVTASDLSPEALEVAAGNAAALGASVRFVQGDLLAPFREGRAHAGERIDILVSNPPYIPSSDLPGLQAEVRDHEPRLALDGGPDGLAPYRRMAEQLSGGLAELPAIVAWEVGIHQAEQAAALLREVADWDEIRIVRDYGGIDRHVLALRF